MTGDLRARMKITESKVVINKLKMIAMLKLTAGPLYIVTLIEIIKKTKDIFINELIMGREVRIPDKLTIKYSQDKKGQMNDLPPGDAYAPRTNWSWPPVPLMWRMPSDSEAAWPPRSTCVVLLIETT